MIFILVAIGISILYFRLFLIYTKSWNNLITVKKINKSDSVSIVVACKNEEDNIIRLIEDVKKQDFDKERLEMIIVNDHSDDRTYEILQKEIIKWKKLTLINMNHRESGKKMAIRKGIYEAKGEIIFCTDADCLLGKNWIKDIINYFTDKQTLFVSSPIIYNDSKGLFQHFQLLELVALMASGAASIFRNKPIFCNGANIAFRKDIYKKISEDEFKNFVNDDVSLLNYIHNNHPYSVRFAKEINAAVSTKFNYTYSSFLTQKIRWIRFAKNEQNIHAFNVGIIVFIMNLLIFGCFFLSCINILYENTHIVLSISKYMFVILFTLKSIVDYKFISPVLSFFQKDKLLIYIFPFQIIFSFYVTLIVPLSLIIKPKWKNKPIF